MIKDKRKVTYTGESLRAKYNPTDYLLMELEEHLEKFIDQSRERNVGDKIISNTGWELESVIISFKLKKGE